MFLGCAKIDNGGPGLFAHNSMSAKLIAIAVVEHAGQYLIGRRPEGVPLAGLWEFPGGKVEPGEGAATAAVRECAEEAGLTVEAVGEYPAHEETYAHGTVHLRFFACRLIDELTEPREPFRWVRRTELGQYEFPNGNQGLLRLLIQGTTETQRH